jgi:isoleucyl-tRNA synthetase
MAPITPFFAEYIFQAVRESEDEESVHLVTWPEARATANFLQRLLGQGKEGEELLSTMSFARDVVTNALMQRSEAGIKVRQPLTKLTIKLSGSEPVFWKDMAPLIADEVNVKEVVLGNDSVLDTEITTELKEEGIVRDFVRSVQEARKEAKLTPRDKVKVFYGAGADEGVLLKHKAEILSATNATELLKGGEEVRVEKI